MTSGWNAKRFAGKPLCQPTYSFKDIPRCSRDLRGSSLQEVTERDHFNDTMAEMVLLCKEAMRRLAIDRLNGKKTSKPLSLEYIADRLDVDDPIFGYFVRTDVPPSVNAPENWKQGMLQGFITVTTFTNWQKTFRWDSMHDSAFSYDHEELADQMVTKQRRYDVDSSLAEALQSTVRCGDPWNEGIVWPRIAEISLLGGLGCGKALVSLVIEKLEAMKASGTRNYDYVVLQATDNSIPFYESMRFVRVGCITEDDKFEKKQAKAETLDEEEVVAEPVENEEADTLATPSEVVTSPVAVYVTKTPGETPTDIAKRHNVDVWDIIFLNQYIYDDINTRSRLIKGTSLYIPSELAKVEAMSHAGRSRQYSDKTSAPQWHIAKENDTPNMIAKRYKVNCGELVQANRGRLPELQAISRLKEGTRIKVSHFHIHDDKHVPYCHWTFPDDSFESNEPSYMMARKLNRRLGPLPKKTAESSMAVPITKYKAPPVSLITTVQIAPSPGPVTKGSEKKRSRHPGEPEPPKRPLSGYMIYCTEQREIVSKEMAGKPGSEVTKVMSKAWNELPDQDKAKYQAAQEQERARYREAMLKYKKDLTAFQKAHPGLKHLEDASDGKTTSLFNKVVKLNADGIAQSGSEFEYYFVLTFIPDLQWCHLAPMRKIGMWGADKPKAEGRPIWMLVDESEGKEVDISSRFCVAVKSRAMKRTADADDEQWDIIDDVVSPSCSMVVALNKENKTIKLMKRTDAKVEKALPMAPIFTNRAQHGLESMPTKVDAKIPPSRSATKPLNGSLERKRKRSKSVEGQTDSSLGKEKMIPNTLDRNKDGQGPGTPTTETRQRPFRKVAPTFGTSPSPKKTSTDKSGSPRTVAKTRASRKLTTSTPLMLQAGPTARRKIS